MEGGDAIEVIQADNWRTKAAQEARDAARAAGKTPLLPKLAGELTRMNAALTEQLRHFKDAPMPFTAGQSERTIIWQEDNGVWCRARADWLSDDRAQIDDYKTTSGTANPETFSRSIFDRGYDVQAAFYLRGLRHLFGVDARFRFIVQETEPPFALSVIALGPDALTLAEKKVLYALEVWATCLEIDVWPAYPLQTCYATLPAWEESRWLAKELA